MDTYVSIDIETTGLNPETCQILEIAAIIDNGELAEGCPIFHCYVDNGLIQGQSYALSMHPIILRRIAERTKSYAYLAPSRVAIRLKEFFRDNDVDMPITVAGKNFAGLDAQFLKRLPHWNRHIQMRQRVLDPATMYWLPKIDGMELPCMKLCMERAGLSGEVVHNAVEDARVVIRLVRKAIVKMIS